MDNASDSLLVGYEPVNDFIDIACHGRQRPIGQGCGGNSNRQATASTTVAVPPTPTFTTAIHMGVRIGFGTDAGVYPHGMNATELRLMVERGMKPIDALKSATSADAELLGLTGRIGSLERGKAADVIAVPGDPTQILAGTLKAGDRVDLVANLSVDATPGGHATRIILRDLTVLQAAGAPSSGPVSQQASVILEVTDSQVQRLFYVMKNAEWTLELRPPVDATDGPARLDTLQSVLESGGLR